MKRTATSYPIRALKHARVEQLMDTASHKLVTTYVDITPRQIMDMKVVAQAILNCLPVPLTAEDALECNRRLVKELGFGYYRSFEYRKIYEAIYIHNQMRVDRLCKQ
ncbi:MAG TPA: hypothetical protein VFC02_06360 [Anaerolineales bacterium]|nr:hypothetical protein [Anaerolineales bacterium]